MLCWPFARFDVAGGDDINRVTPKGIIVVNHRSLFDVAAGLVVLHGFRRYPRVLIEKKYVDAAWTAPFARAIGAIPVDRSAPRGEAFAAAVASLDAGATILILPEGRLHWNPADPLTTGPASTGVSRLAEVSGAPVVPAGMIGTERVWPAARPLPHLNPFRRRPWVTVRVSDAAVALDGDDHHSRTEVIMAEVRAMMARCQADADRREEATGRRSLRSPAPSSTPPADRPGTRRRGRRSGGSGDRHAA